jgi:hypothetical protein
MSPQTEDEFYVYVCACFLAGWWEELSEYLEELSGVKWLAGHREDSAGWESGVVRICLESGVVRSCWDLVGVIRICQELPGIVLRVAGVGSCQDLSGVVRISPGVVRHHQDVIRIYQDFIVRTCNSLGKWHDSLGVNILATAVVRI